MVRSERSNIDRILFFFKGNNTPVWRAQTGFFFSDQISLSPNDTEQQSFVRNNVCEIAWRVSTRVHAERELSHMLHSHITKTFIAHFAHYVH